MVEGRTHRPVIDNEKCNACSVCIRGCPAETILEMRQEESSLRGRLYKEVTTMPLINVEKVFDSPPCQATCPIHQDVRRYINLIAQKKYKEALEVIRETNALPSVCGYVCHHPCEEKCVRNLVDDSASIKNLKRFIADYDDGKLAPPSVGNNTSGLSFAIICSTTSGVIGSTYVLSATSGSVIIVAGLLLTKIIL